MYLLDANVLIAIVQSEHTDRSQCLRWFRERHHHGWATCPLVENAMVRVLSDPSVSGGSFTAPEIVTALARLTGSPGHRFVPDDISISDETLVHSRRIVGSKQIGDAYLLGLCRKHGMKLATLDRRIEPALAPGEAIVELIA